MGSSFALHMTACFFACVMTRSCPQHAKLNSRGLKHGNGNKGAMPRSFPPFPRNAFIYPCRLLLCSKELREDVMVFSALACLANLHSPSSLIFTKCHATLAPKRTDFCDWQPRISMSLAHRPGALILSFQCSKLQMRTGTTKANASPLVNQMLRKKQVYFSFCRFEKVKVWWNCILFRTPHNPQHRKTCKAFAHIVRQVELDHPSIPKNQCPCVPRLRCGGRIWASRTHFFRRSLP